MKSDDPQSLREELEVRLTALLLGELPDDDAAILHRALENDAELARLYQRLKETIDLTRAAVAEPAEQTAAGTAPLRLSDERREKLLAKFKTVAPQEFSQPKYSQKIRLLEWAAVLAVIAVLSGMLLPSLGKAKARAQRINVVSNLKNLEVAKRMWASDHDRADGDAVVIGDLTEISGGAGNRPIAGEKYIVGKVGEPVVAELSAGEAKKFYLPEGAKKQLAGLKPDQRVHLSSEGMITVVGDDVKLANHPNQSKGERASSSSSLATLAKSSSERSPTEIQLPSGGQAAGEPQEKTPQKFSLGIDVAYDAHFGDGLERQKADISPANPVLGGRASEPLGWGGTVVNGQTREEKMPAVASEFRGGGYAFGGGAGRGDAPASGSGNKSLFDQSGNQGLWYESAGKKSTDWALPQVGASAGGVRGDSTIESSFYKTSDAGMTQFGMSAGLPVPQDDLGLVHDPVPLLAPTIPNFNFEQGRNSSQLTTVGGIPVVGRFFRSTNVDRLSQLSDHRDALGNYAIEQKVDGIEDKLGKKFDLATIEKPALPGSGASRGSSVLRDLLEKRSVELDAKARQTLAQDRMQPGEKTGKIERDVLQDREGKQVQSRIYTGLDAASNSTFNSFIVASGPPVQSDDVAALESDVAIRKPAAQAPVPQPEIATAANPFSTFALNVSDVSFKLAAASLEKGQMPDPGSVRSEEFINAFDYRDPEPPRGVPVAFVSERARDPFAHNRDLLRFSLKTAAAGREAGRPLNLVLLLDNSGSMERADRVRIIRAALRVLAAQLKPQDKFSIVTFARTARLWVDGVAGDQAAAVIEQVSSLTPQGGTNLEEAMDLGYRTALRHYLANGVNRLVLLTDGAANLGNVEPDALKQKVEANRKQGIALDCFGIGWEGFNDDLLEVLSSHGDGRYGFINSPEEAAADFASQLAGALKVAAADVKVQVEFNPRRVTSYRQIGYAKHQLAKEQFRDNAVDAAEMGAAEAGNALYSVAINPQGQGPIGTVRVRFRIPGTSDYREHAWEVPFNGNAPALQQSTPAMRLAATAGAFAESLASSPFASEVTPDELLRTMVRVPEIYGADARPKKLEWMIRQAKSISGK
jgi:Mg-chelatase subunit ChlD/type II secretory pathway pseudopilin PulG